MTEATIHALYVWKLSKELAKEYDEVLTNVELTRSRRIVAEIDVLARRGDTVHVFEVKRSFRPTKARQQFRKIRKHFSENIEKFFLYAAEPDTLLELTP